MKGYKFLIPVLLIAAFVGSIYSLYSKREKIEEEYQGYLQAARSAREKEIYVDAEASYMSALDVRPSIELYVEIGEFYNESNERKAEDWGETILDEYPEETAGYEFVADRYIKVNDYVSCFKLYDTLNARKLKSEHIEKIISSIKYEFYISGEFEGVRKYTEGLCPVQLNGLWGYAGGRGTVAVPCRYVNAGPFSGGLAPVTEQDGSAYFIDTAGNKKFVITNVDNIKEYTNAENNVLGINDGECWRFYNGGGEYLFGEYDEVSSISNGVIAVKQGENWGIIDLKGKSLSDASYEEVLQDENGMVYVNERLFVREQGKYYMTDRNGKKITEQAYEDARLFNDETYAAVKLDGRWGYIDKTGKQVIEPTYSKAGSFSNGFAAVEADGHWGYIDMSNNMVIEPQFSGAKDFNAEGCAFVKQNDVWSLLLLYSHNH